MIDNESVRVVVVFSFVAGALATFCIVVLAAIVFDYVEAKSRKLHLPIGPLPVDRSKMNFVKARLKRAL